MPRVVVVGSLVMDLVVRAPRRPRKGETLLGDSFGMFLGGKGFNQAVTAARMGASVSMVGCLGGDPFAPPFREALEHEGIDQAHVRTNADAITGVGAPVIDAEGDNSIILVPGANLTLDAQAIGAAAELIAAADVLLLQLEVPQPASRRAAEIARAGDTVVILDPAPAVPLDPALLAAADYLVPNEVEALALLGREIMTPADVVDAATQLRSVAPGLNALVVTRGEHGALVAQGGTGANVPPCPTTVVDTTGAGDAFAGALAAELASGVELATALRTASAAGAEACAVLGAEPSMPTRAAVMARLAS